MRILASLTAACAAAAFAAAPAAEQTYTAILDSKQTVPAKPFIQGTGFATLTLTGSSIFVDLHATNLRWDYQKVMLFRGAPGTNGTMALDLLTAPGTGTAAFTSATLDITKTYTGLSSLSAEFATGQPFYLLLSGANSPIQGGGLIRGNLSPTSAAIPEPSSATLTLCGALPLLGLIRRRRTRR